MDAAPAFRFGALRASTPTGMPPYERKPQTRWGTPWDIVASMRLAIILGALVLSVGIGFAGQKQSSVVAEQKKLAALEKAYTQAKTAYAKNPKDGAAKKKLVACATSYADTVLVSPALKPTEKYPKALSLYREILRLDPKNKNAASNRDLIESIYKSMGRPIPKG